MITYNTFEELHAEYAERYGENWDREKLDDDSHWEFIMACYDLYSKKMKLRDTFCSNASDQIERNGQRFEIVSPITDDHDWDLIALPAYRIRFTDTGDVIDAYPDEIFEDFEIKPFKSRWTKELSDAIDTVCGACPYIVDDDDNAGEKYCERCMVRLMTDLFRAQDKAQSELPETAPEWQAISNY